MQYITMYWLFWCSLCTAMCYYNMVMMFLHFKFHTCIFEHLHITGPLYSKKTRAFILTRSCDPFFVTCNAVIFCFSLFRGRKNFYIDKISVNHLFFFIAVMSKVIHCIYSQSFFQWIWKVFVFTLNVHLFLFYVHDVAVMKFSKNLTCIYFLYL